MISALSAFWSRNGWTCILIFSVVMIFLIWLLKGWFGMKGSSTVNGGSIFSRLFAMPRVATTTVQKKEPNGNLSRGEDECKKFVEFYFKKPFQRIRPAFLTNPITGAQLELDMYNDELKLAIEYNGAQHYVFNNMMHQGSRDKFQNQQYRDYMKKTMCKENGIDLIIVPYTVKHQDIAAYLIKHLKQLGYSPVP